MPWLPTSNSSLPRENIMMDPFDWADLDSVIFSVKKIQDTLTHDCTSFHIKCSQRLHVLR